MRRTLLGMALLLGACASARGPETLAPHLDGFVPDDVDVSLPTLGVALFTDARSERSREVVATRFGASGWGVGWRGETQTGDASFDGPLVEGARADAIATLQRSGAFSDVRPLEAWGERASDYVLTGTLEELVALQYSSAMLDLARIGFFRREIDDAAGIVRIAFELQRRGVVVWDDRIETWLRVPGVSPARAALDALAATHERLAHQLYVKKLGAGLRTAPRLLAVRVLDGCGLGSKQVRRHLADASEVLERELAVRLVAHPETWSPPAGMATLDRVLEAVARETPPHRGVVLALVPFRARGVLLEPARFGLARALGEHAVVTCREREPVRALTIAHEIAHLFGAVHVRDRSSVMNAIAEFDARFFDPLNRRILRAARTRRFGGPLDPALAEQLEALYRAGAHARVPAEVSDLNRAISTVQTRAER